jgi:transcription elongation factor Elf1
MRRGSRCRQVESMVLAAEIPCPFCGETYSTSIDTSQGNHEMIEDCAVCCRPIRLTVTCAPGEISSIIADSDC